MPSLAVIDPETSICGPYERARAKAMINFDGFSTKLLLLTFPCEYFMKHFEEVHSIGTL